MRAYYTRVYSETEKHPAYLAYLTVYKTAR